MRFIRSDYVVADTDSTQKPSIEKGIIDCYQ